MGAVMGGLGFKVFVSFWTIHAALFVIFATTGNQGPDVRLTDHVAHDAAIAAALFEDQGAGSCEVFVQTTGVETGLWVNLSDTSGATLCQSVRTGSPQSVTSAQVVRLPLVSRHGQTLRASGTSDATFEERFSRRPPAPYRTMLLLIVTSGLVCFGLARYLARPLREMRQATVRLARGDLRTRVGARVGRRHDEIGDLVRDFDAMATRIEALVDSQRQLLSDISHELRSPLARLQVALELTRRKAGVTAEADLDRIESEANRMNDLIGRVLVLARAEQSGEHVRRPVDLQSVVRHVAEDADYEAGRADESVAVHADADVVVPGDPELIASAIDNVVRNAVRHTNSGTTVEVVVTADDHDAVVTVRDYGAGVPESELERIFTPFHRLDAARHRDDGGTGLGLAIARRAMAVHGGHIAAVNAPDGGLLVTLRFPLDADVDTILQSSPTA